MQKEQKEELQNMIGILIDAEKDLAKVLAERQRVECLSDRPSGRNWGRAARNRPLEEAEAKVNEANKGLQSFIEELEPN